MRSTLRISLPLGLILASSLLAGCRFQDVNAIIADPGEDTSDTSDAGAADGGADTDARPDADTCETRLTCEDYPDAMCGRVSDGCGGSLSIEEDCGRPGCGEDQLCGVEEPNQCGSTCVPLSCGDLGAVECGVISDGCGGQLDVEAECDVSCGDLEVCGAGNLCDPLACEPLTCGALGAAECGVIPDGCGGTVDLDADCGVRCGDDELCGADNLCEPDPCDPLVCADVAGLACGVVPDGCGGTLDLVAACGAPGCGAGESCGGTDANQCSPDACVPDTCTDVAGVACGTVSDGCSGVIDIEADCGRACPAGEHCGAGNTCEPDACVPDTCADIAGIACGTVSDGCSGVIDIEADCGRACPVGEHCGAGNTCEPDGCIPLSCGDVADAECGVIDDGCGGVIDVEAACGAPGCSAPETCGAAGSGLPLSHDHLCGDPCPIRMDCGVLFNRVGSCGIHPDGCGGVIDMAADCGYAACGGSESCHPGRFGWLECSADACTPLTCVDFAAGACGLVGDGCGGIIDLEAACGAPGCAAPEICGGGAAGPNQCGDPSCTYPRLTCDDFAAMIADATASGDPLCGVFDDRCGGTLDLVADCGAPGCVTCTRGATPAARCTAIPDDPMESYVCFESAAGCPGEVIEVPVHVMLPSTCADPWTSQRSGRFNVAEFELINQRGDACGLENCTRRDTWEDSLDWTQFPGMAIGCSDAQCPPLMPSGHVDTLVIRVKPTTPAGTYAPALDSHFIGNPCNACADDGCWIDGGGVGPLIEVY